MKEGTTLPATLAVLLALFCLADVQAGKAATATSQPSRDPRGDGLDPWSRGCLACHDGIQASYVATRQAGTPAPYDGHRSLDHPIGMRYRDYPARDPRAYRYLLALDPSIVLVEGRVGCVSCHRIKQAPPASALETGSLRLAEANECASSHQLAGDKRAGGLCLACHLL